MREVVERRVAIVTGGGSGIGRETALAFVKRGASVVIADKSVVSGEEAAHEIKALGGEAIFINTDVGSADSVSRMVDLTLSSYGQLDYAFNNAGLATKGFAAIEDYDEAEWDELINVNLKGVWLCLKYECRAMAKRKNGAIVNTSSIIGKVGRPGLSAYAASKSGVIGLTKSVALDYAKAGLRINAICPGGISTAMTDSQPMRERMQRFAEATPMGRMGNAKEIADTVLWLCSSEASYITGQAISVDGGYGVW